MINAFERNGEIFIEGNSLQNKKCFFEKPFNSSFLNIFEVNTLNVMTEKITINSSEILCKFFPIHYETDIYVMVPLLHTLNE